MSLSPRIPLVKGRIRIKVLRKVLTLLLSYSLSCWCLSTSTFIFLLGFWTPSINRHIVGFRILSNYLWSIGITLDVQCNLWKVRDLKRLSDWSRRRFNERVFTCYKHIFDSSYKRWSDDFTSPTGNNKTGIVSPMVSLLATD